MRLIDSAHLAQAAVTMCFKDPIPYAAALFQRDALLARGHEGV